MTADTPDPRPDRDYIRSKGRWPENPDPRPRVTCVCGISVLPENWSNHLLRQDGKRHYLPRPVSPPAPQADAGLRERIYAVVAEHEDETGYARYGGDALLRDIQRALAASPAAPAGLDVERLAEAMYFACGDPVTEPFHGEGEHRVWLRRARTALAHLASQPSEDGPA